MFNGVVLVKVQKFKYWSYKSVSCTFVSSLRQCLFTGSIPRSASRRYLVYSEADFEVFHPSGTTRCTNVGEIRHGGGDLRWRFVAAATSWSDRIGLRWRRRDFDPLLHAKFHPHRCKHKGVGPEKLQFLLRFDRNVEYKRSIGASPLRNFLVSRKLDTFRYLTVQTAPC